ncbi:hypothetical protein ACFLYL_02690 [Chloroflexota bacterium]
MYINYKGGPEVVPGREQIEAVRTGVVDMSYNMAGASSGVVTELKAIMVSGMGPKELRDSGYLDLVNKACQEKGNFYYLAHLSDNYKFFLYWKPEVKDPRTDFKGLKLRSGGTYNPGIKRLGAEVVNIPTAEVFTAIERGVIDGMGWPLTGIATHPGVEKEINYAHAMGVNGGGGELFVNLPISRPPSFISGAFADKLCRASFLPDNLFPGR